MGGLGFIHPGFLAAAAAVAVPVLIHLLFRRRARRVEIGTLHFLRAVLRDQARRRRVRRWVLLALRVAGVLLLALLFARPFWRAPEASGSQREVVILIDRSASMGAGTAGSTPLEKARRRAVEIVRDLPEGAAVRLAAFDSDRVVPMPVGQLDSGLSAGLNGTDYTRAFAWARDVVVASRRARREVQVLTDLQRCGIGAPLADGFPESVDVELIDVGRPSISNLAVEDVVAEQTDLRGRRPVTVAARVFNAGAFRARDVRVRLAIDGRPAVEQTATIDARARRVVRFEVPIDQPGLYQGSVEVAGGDDLAFDDRRWLAFEARRPDRILLVDGEPGPSVYGNETYYLETALRLRLPGDESSESPTPYEPTRIAWGGQAGSLPDLRPYSVVVLCNVADVSDADAVVLRRFVEAGGGLVVFPGDLVGPGAATALESAGLAPARSGGPSEIGSYRFAAWEKDYPLFGPFADPQYGDLRTLRFRRVARLTAESGCRVLATATDGSPLVVERSVGRGRSLVFAFPADNAWGDWSIHRLYVPLMHQLFGDLTGRLPETARVRSEQAGEGEGLGPGVSVSDGRAVVRNVDPAESDVERTTAAKLREFYRLPEGRGGDDRPKDEAATLAAEGERPDEHWRAVAWVLLAVLVLEMFVANRSYMTHG